MANEDLDISPDALIRYGQTRRLKYLMALDNGEEVQEPSKMEAAIEKNMVNAALAEKRMVVDEKSNEGQAELANTMATVISALGRDPFSRDNLRKSGVDLKTSNFKAPDLPTPELVEGELSEKLEQHDDA